MEIKKVGIPVVKPVGGTASTPVTPVAVKPVGVAPIQVAQAVKPVTQAVAQAPVQAVVEEEKPKGGLFGGGSVADVPKEERLNDVKSAVNKVQSKSVEVSDEGDEDTDEADEKKTKSKKKVEDNKPKFNVPLKVRIYDREVFVVDDINMTEDQIRIKAADEYGFFEFDKERTKFIYNDAKNEVVLKASFEKRG